MNFDRTTIFLFTMFAIAIATTVICNAIKAAAKKPAPSKDVSFDSMVARVAATGWHFSAMPLSNSYRIWHGNAFGQFPREIEATPSGSSSVALWLHVLGCLKRDETFDALKPDYAEAHAWYPNHRPNTASEIASMLLHFFNNSDSDGVTRNQLNSSVIEMLASSRPSTEYDRTWQPLHELATAFVSGRAVSETALAAWLDELRD